MPFSPNALPVSAGGRERPSETASKAN
jgi:hypothetical protein